MTTSSVTPAVQAAAVDARSKLISMAVADTKSPLQGASPDEVDFKDGKLFRKSSPDRSEDFTTLLKRHGNAPVEGSAHLKPDLDQKKFSSHSFGAVFAEVAVDSQIILGLQRRNVRIDTKRHDAFSLDLRTRRPRTFTASDRL